MPEPAGFVVAVQVHGLKGLQQDFRTARNLTPRAMTKTNKAVAAEVVVPAAKQEAPERSGDLAASIRASGRQLAGRVVAGKKAVPYAGPIHFGWANRPRGEGPIRPDPFLYRALDRRRDEVINRYEKAVDQLIRESF